MQPHIDFIPRDARLARVNRGNAAYYLDLAAWYTRRATQGVIPRNIATRKARKLVAFAAEARDMASRAGAPAWSGADHHNIMW